ncbi:MAG: ATP-binding protein [Candidatus Aenigmarchaeota archaeon]|nr:ATP-binding protein [Candidatus Aenigmarchaeota archaeon]MDW8149294.1 ATP-binding protein [Candidatus Aenigmarchaeota archaeon]
MIGKVISFENTPNTKEFWFITSSSINVGTFVKVDNVVAKVVEIVNTNKYYSNIFSLKEFFDTGREMKDFLPVDKWDVTLAKAINICSLENGHIKGIDNVIKAGSTVNELNKEDITTVLGLDEKGISIGCLKFNGMEIKLNIDKLFRKHCAIIAQSGYGKSYTVQVILEEFLKMENKLPAVVIIDTHGEYTYFQDYFPQKFKNFSIEEVRFAAYELTEERIGEVLPELTEIGKRELRKVIKNLKEKKKVFDFKDIILEVERSKINENVKAPMLSSLEMLDSLNLFSKVSFPLLEDEIKPNKIINFDISQTISLRKKQTFVSLLLRNLFNLIIEKKIPPTIIFIEEGHQFAPEIEDKFRALSKGIIETIAREGRKFAIGLVLISQRPIQLSKTALSQCDTKIIMHLSNPYDIDYIGRSVEQLTNEELNSLTSLSIGEAFVCGEVVRFPILIKVKEKSLKSINTSRSFSEIISEFEKA